MEEKQTQKEVLIHLPENLFETAQTDHFEGTVPWDQLLCGTDVYFLLEPVSWFIDVTNTGEAMLVQGKAETLARTECARCLDEVEYHLEGDIEGYYLLGEQGEVEEPEDLEGDEFEYLPSNRTVDIAPLISAALLIEAPLMPLCRDDCKGLCLQCGANLNEGACGCEQDTSAEFDTNPFAALRNLKLDE